MQILKQILPLTSTAVIHTQNQSLFSILYEIAKPSIAKHITVITNPGSIMSCP
jgi:hypothetical protein